MVKAEGEVAPDQMENFGVAIQTDRGLATRVQLGKVVEVEIMVDKDNIQLSRLEANTLESQSGETSQWVAFHFKQPCHLGFLL